jgi:hypothetical protein
MLLGMDAMRSALSLRCNDPTDEHRDDSLPSNVFKPKKRFRNSMRDGAYRLAPGTNCKRPELLHDGLTPGDY